MKGKYLLIAALSLAAFSCEQNRQMNTQKPDKEDQNFEERRQQMQQQKSGCCQSENADKPAAAAPAEVKTDKPV